MRRAMLLTFLFLLLGCGARQGVIPTPPAIPTPQGMAGLTATPLPTATLSPAELQPPLLPAAQIVATTTLPIASYRVVTEYPHDRLAYTQGLLYSQGTLYESTGLYGQSSLRQVALDTGEVMRQVALDPAVFGEGLALVDDRLIQLTWQSSVGYVYSIATFEQIQSWDYPTEGWGLAYDGTRLIMSDGTDLLTFRDPQSFAELGRLAVTAEGQPLSALNELEMVNGELYANIYTSDLIARIDPVTGNVLGWINLGGLLPAEQRNGTEDVLNGIAFDPAGQRLFVTGKLWPTLFQIEIVTPN